MNGDSLVKALEAFGGIILYFFLYIIHKGMESSERDKRLAEQQFQQRFIDNLKQRYKLDTAGLVILSLGSYEKRVYGFMLDKHSEKIIIIEDNLPKFYSFSDLFNFRIHAHFDNDGCSSWSGDIYKYDCILEKERAEEKGGYLDSMDLYISFKDSNRVKHSHHIGLGLGIQLECHDCTGTEVFNKASTINDYLTNILDDKWNKLATEAARLKAEKAAQRAAKQKERRAAEKARRALEKAAKQAMIDAAGSEVKAEE